MKNFLFLLVCLFCILFGCKKLGSDPSPNSNGNQSIFSQSCITSNRTWYFNDIVSETHSRAGLPITTQSICYDSAGAYFSKNKLLFFGSDTNGSFMMQIVNPRLGLNDKVSCWSVRKSGGSYFYGNGSITITEFDTLNAIISGNYSMISNFEWEGATHTGAFFELPISTYPNYISTGKNSTGVGIISVKNEPIPNPQLMIDNFNFDNSIAFVGKKNGLLNLTSSNLPGLFSLQLPENIQPGTFKTDTLNISVSIDLSSNNHYGGNSLKPRKATITIQSHNTSTKNIEGTINGTFGCSACIYPTSETTINGGYFNIHYK